MKLKEIAERLGLEVIAAKERLEEEVSSGYTSDLLSDVIANSKERNLWITLQIHPNVVAVAKLKDLAGIVVINGRIPEEETKEKAQKEGIPLLLSKESAFTLSGKLYALLKGDN